MRDELPHIAIERRRFENECPLLNRRAREAIRLRAAECAARFVEQISALQDRVRHQPIESPPLIADKGIGESRQDVDTGQQEIREMVAGIASEMVREYANGILLTQGRLGVHAVVIVQVVGAI